MDKPKSVYIYPDTLRATNEYVLFIHQAFKDNNIKVRSRLSFLRLFNLLLNLDAAVFIIQWVDMLPQLKLGKLRCLYLKFSIHILNIFGKKIVWIMHNKTSHNDNSQNRVIADQLMWFMAKYSDEVIVHAQDGVEFYNEKFGKKYPNKAIYIPHPVYKTEIYTDPQSRSKWDFIIWGTVSKYKNILNFVKFAKQNTFFRDKKILICGKCHNQHYGDAIEKELLDNKQVTFQNHFLTDEELAERIKESKNILFTYAQDSVLSSGALIYSLNFCKPIIGPKIGNFKELDHMNVYTYKVFEDIQYLDFPLSVNSSDIKVYLQQNAWIYFPGKVLENLS